MPSRVLWLVLSVSVGAACVGRGADAGSPAADAGSDGGLVVVDAGVDAGLVVMDAGDDAGPPCLGHDEDGDGVPDDCDNCPGIENAGQEDVRETGAGNVADGVGDACDPRPNVSGDAILHFEPFTSPSSDWNLDDSFSVGGDRLTTTGADEEFARLLTIDRNVVAVHARLVLTDVAPPAADADFGISIRGGSAGGDTTATCSVIEDSAGPETLQMYFTDAAGADLALQDDDTLPAVEDVIFDMVLIATSNQVRCDVQGGNAGFNSTFTGTGWIGVRTDDAEGEVLSLTVFSLGG